MAESVDHHSGVPPRPSPPWTVTAATSLALAATVMSLLAAGLTVAIVDSSMTKGAIAQMESGLSSAYDEHSLDSNAAIVKVAAALWVVINLIVAALALAAGSGRLPAFHTLLGASVVVFIMACCCCEGPVIDCVVLETDTCGEQRSGFPTWYFPTLKALAFAQVSAWLSGIGLFVLPRRARAYIYHPPTPVRDPPSSLGGWRRGSSSRGRRSPLPPVA
jgi:hypothetical protein